METESNSKMENIEQKPEQVEKDKIENLKEEEKVEKEAEENFEKEKNEDTGTEDEKGKEKEKKEEEEKGESGEEEKDKKKEEEVKKEEEESEETESGKSEEEESEETEKESIKSEEEGKKKDKKDKKDKKKKDKKDKKNKQKKEKKDKKERKKNDKKDKKDRKDKKKKKDKQNKEEEKKGNEGVFEVILMQSYMKEPVQKILEHLAMTLPGMNVTVSLNDTEKPSEYLNDLFVMMKETVESRQVSEEQQSQFIEKYRNKIFESGIFLDDKQMDKKYFVVNYEETQPPPKAKKFNAFYKVDDAMDESEGENQQDTNTSPPGNEGEEEALVVDNLQEMSPEAQEEMGKKIAEVIRDDVQIVKEIQYEKPNE